MLRSISATVMLRWSMRSIFMASLAEGVRRSQCHALHRRASGSNDRRRVSMAQQFGQAEHRCQQRKKIYTERTQNNADKPALGAPGGSFDLDFEAQLHFANFAA